MGNGDVFRIVQASLAFFYIFSSQGGELLKEPTFKRHRHLADLRIILGGLRCQGSWVPGASGSLLKPLGLVCTCTSKVRDAILSDVGMHPPGSSWLCQCYA